MRCISAMVLSCIIAVVVGTALDERFHTSPILVICALAYAIGASLYLMIKKLGVE